MVVGLAIIAVLVGAGLGAAVAELELIRRRLQNMRVPDEQAIQRALVAGMSSMSAEMARQIQAAAGDIEVLERARQYQENPVILENVSGQVHQILAAVILARAEMLAERHGFVAGELVRLQREHQPGVMMGDRSQRIQALDDQESSLRAELEKADAAAATLGVPREAS